MRKLEKKFIKRHQHQEIIITGSPLIRFFETVGLWLHILAFFLGFATLLGVFTHEASEFTHTLEIVTLIVIALIILQFALTPIIERFTVKRLLRDFWGTNEIATSLKYSRDIDPMKNFGTIIDEVVSLQLEETKLGWTTVRKFPWKRVLTIQQSTPITTKRWSRYASSEGTFNTAFVPIYIIVDVHQKVIKFQGRVNVLFTRHKNIAEKRIMFTFHYKDKVANWSGIFPEHPLYGEWIWDKTISQKIKEDTTGKRNQALRNNKAVANVFESRRSSTEETNFEGDAPLNAKPNVEVKREYELPKTSEHDLNVNHSVENNQQDNNLNAGVQNTQENKPATEENKDEPYNVENKNSSII